MSKTFHTFKLNDDECETLLQLLDFACSQLYARMGGTVMDKWDGFAVKLSRTKVDKLRTTMFPLIRPATMAGK